MSALKKAIKNNGLTIGLGIFDSFSFDPSCQSCTTSCAVNCSVGCPVSSAPSAKPPVQ